jgi:predicted PurR-regulated permease PerM
MNKASEPSADLKSSDATFSRRCLGATLIALSLAGLATLIYFSLEPLFALFTGLLFAIFLRGLGNFLARHSPIRDPWSVVVVLLFLLALLGLAGWWISGPLANEYQQLQQRLPEAITKLEQEARDRGLELSALNGHSTGQQLTSHGTALLGGAVSAFRVTLRSIVLFIVILFVGIYVSFSPDTYTHGLLALVPQRHRPRAREILAETEQKLRAWLIGQFISMINVGVLIGLGLWISGIPVPLVLGFIAGALDIIPLFGPVIASIPAILLGFTLDPLHAGYAVLVFVVANQIESHVILPLIQRMSVSLPPALTVAALLILGTLFGFWGVLLAVPITITLLVLIQKLYIRQLS